MPLKPHPTDPDKMVFVSLEYDTTDWKAKYSALLDQNSRIGTSDSDKGEYAIHQVRIFRERLAAAIEQMPFGDTAASFATFVRGFK